MSAIIRIKKELLDYNADLLPNITAGPINNNDLLKWRATIIGPEDSPYEGGIFHLNFTYPLDYPFKPPKCIFTTKIYHPNIDSFGNISLDIFKDQWPPNLTFEKFLLSISSLLSDPNPEDPINYEAASLYKTNNYEYYKKQENGL